MTTNEKKLYWRTELQKWLQKNIEHKNLPKDMKQIREEFVNKFPVDKLKNLTLEEYALGHSKSDDSFCKWLEFKTKRLGSVGVGNVSTWQVSWGKKENDWKYVKKYASPEDALAKITKVLTQLTNNAKLGNYDDLDEVGKLLPLPLRLKPLYLYFPDEILPIFNIEHMEHFLKIFEQKPKNERDKFVAVNRQLLAVMRQQEEFSSFDTHGMMRFLYDCFYPVNPDAILVGAGKIDKKLVSEIELLNQKGGKLAFWWSFPLKEKYEAVLKEEPYLYVYLGGEKNHITRRYHVIDWAKSVGETGRECPSEWQPYIEDEELIGKIRLPDSERGKAGIFKTWFLVDKIESIEEIPLRNLHEYNNNRQPAQPFQNGFKIWLKEVETSQSEEDVKKNRTPNEVLEKLLNQLKDLAKETRNIILYGPPGTGKTFVAYEFAKRFLQDQSHVEERIKRVTFHQSFYYEEFVEGIRPESKNGQISYPVKSGIFREFCEKAEQEWKKSREQASKYVLVIDEINRANIAKVLGELITLIEDDKRLGQEHSSTVELPYSRDKFGIPPNIYILGTMNTTDRSIALLDTALRRRFAFIEIMPELSLLNKTIEGVNLKDILTELNSRICILKDRDHQIGHSYLMGVDNTTQLKFAWYHRIVPLLQEYFYNDGKRLQAVLGENFVKARRESNVKGRLAEVADTDTEIYEVRALDGQEFLQALQKIMQNPDKETESKV